MYMTLHIQFCSTHLFEYQETALLSVKTLFEYDKIHVSAVLFNKCDINLAPAHANCIMSSKVV